ncbi:hypothetical protein Tco_1260859 [Tanacetum coccineum]
MELIRDLLFVAGMYKLDVSEKEAIQWKKWIERPNRCSIGGEPRSHITPSPVCIQAEELQTPQYQQDGMAEPNVHTATGSDYVPELYTLVYTIGGRTVFPVEEHHYSVDSPTAESTGLCCCFRSEENPERWGRVRGGSGEHLAPGRLCVVVPNVDAWFPDLREHSLLYHHPLLTLLPLELGLLSGFRIPYPFHQRQRCTTPPALSSPPPVPSPLLPSSGCPTQIQTLRMSSTQALVDAVTAALPSPPLPPLPPSLYIPPPVDHRNDLAESELPPRKRLCLSTLGSRYEVGESSTARPIGGRGIDYGFVSTVDAKARRQGISEVGYGIRDTWVNPAEIAPMTVGEVNTRVIELVELYERDTQDLHTLLEDAQDGRTRISQRVAMDS